MSLGSRYPAELVKLFEQRQKKDKLDHHWFDALGDSKAPAEEKSRLFLAAAKMEDDWQQIHALRALAAMKHPETGKLVIAALERQPRTPKEEYWVSNMGNFVQIASCLDEGRVWEALLKTGKRVDVGQRLQLLQSIGTLHNSALRERAIRLYQTFLTDGEIRDTGSSKLFEGPGAAFMHKRIAVRDFAAEQLALVLNLKVESDSTWKEPQWQALRDRVQAELAKRSKR